MKFMHLSDLHIGKRVNEFSMQADQEYILQEILELARDEKVEGIIIAGDIYDKALPSTEAVDIFDEFLTKIVYLQIPVFIISGNHDSPERLEFGSRIMTSNQVYIAGTYDGEIKKITKHDAYGPINLYLLPYIKPIIVNRKLGVQTTSYEECMRCVLETISVEKKERNILIAHQYITAAGISPELSDSESLSLGGLDNIDVQVFADFDYVALGHIHGPQQVGRPTVRYSGSPLKYSFSECRHKKSVTIVELREKTVIDIKQLPLIAKRDMQELKCSLAELQSGDTLKKVPKDSYVHITLTDEQEILDGISKVRAIYPNVMLLDFDNQRNRESNTADSLTDQDLKEKTPLQLFAEFFYSQNNQALTENQKKILTDLVSELEDKK